MGSVRIYQKKEIRLDRLNLKQHQMFKLGNVGAAAVKNRLGAALGANGAASKPLTKRYASRIIEQLSQAEVDDVVQAGDTFRVTLRVLGGIVTHVLKMASAKDVTEYRRGFARVLDLPYNRQELTINLTAAGALYKKLITTAEGYAGDAPVMHQAVAVKAAIDALEAGFQEPGDPNS